MVSEVRYADFESNLIGSPSLSSSSGLVLTETCENGLAIVTLNRPEALNAARLDMVTALTSALRNCAMNDQVGAVLIQGAEGPDHGRAFSAGSDLKSVFEIVQDDLVHQATGSYAGFRSGLPVDNFIQEFNGVHAVATCPKPTITLLDGVVMGWGLGLGCSAQYRIVTENSRFAMPENNIGLFADAGFSYLAAKMPPGVGRLMASTGIHIQNPHDALFAGLGTHFVPSGSLPTITEALRSINRSELVKDDPVSVDKRVRSCVEGVARPVPEKKGLLQGPWAKRFAQFEGPADASQQLEAAKQKEKEASQLFESMQKGSPFSQCLSWYLLDEALKERAACSGKSNVLAACSPHDEAMLIKGALERDFAAMYRILWRNDFVEGMQKNWNDNAGNAKWKPGTYSEVSMEEVRAMAMPLDPTLKQLGLPEISTALTGKLGTSRNAFRITSR